MKRIIVFGTGSVAEFLFSKLDFERLRIVGFVDDRRIGSCFHGYKVYSSSEIKNLEFDTIIIASGYVKQISKLLNEHEVSKKQIVSFIFDEIETYTEITEEIRRYLDEEYNRLRIYEYLKNGETIPNIYPAVIWNDSIAQKTIYKDFVREQLVKMIADQLTIKKVAGDIAELGVYKGDFTVVLDGVFCNRSLYLFDTFSGFSESDLAQDSTIENSDGERNKFKDTSEKLVLDRLKYKERIVFKTGIFPETFDLWDHTFAFVSIDVNLEKPVMEALDIFYPRMEHGGMIMVSDYYAPFYGGTRKSVDLWCEINNKTVIPIPDFYGSALFVKE